MDLPELAPAADSVWQDIAPPTMGEERERREGNEDGDSGFRASSWVEGVVCKNETFSSSRRIKCKTGVYMKYFQTWTLFFDHGLDSGLDYGKQEDFY